ncbi:hypothetical protein E2320_002275, partial [Naja naja]
MEWVTNYTMKAPQSWGMIPRKLQDWPECLVVHYFKEGQDKELLKICLCHGVSDRIHSWHWMAIMMNLKPKEEMLEKKPRRQLGRWPSTHQTYGTMEGNLCGSNQMFLVQSTGSSSIHVLGLSPCPTGK